MINDIRVVLHRKKRANGEYPIMVRLMVEGKARYISIGATSLEKDWNKARDEPKASHPDREVIVTLIREAKARLGKDLLVGEVVNVRASLEAAVGKVTTGKVGVLGYCRETRKRLLAEHRIGYADCYKDLENALLKRVDKNRKEVSWVELTPQFLREWESALLQQDCKPGTIRTYFGTLRTLVNYANLAGITKLNPFLGPARFKMGKYQKIKTQKRSISQEEIDKIRSIQAEPKSPEFHALNLFLFSFYTAGLNFSDIARLTPADRRGDFIVFQRKKTGVWQQTYLIDKARTIWDYYYDTMPIGTGQETVFWFILNPRHVTAQQQVDRKKKVNRYINDILKRLGKRVGIKEKLTTYVARHSFANILKTMGVPVEQISELLGHDSVLTTQIYLRSFSSDVLASTMKQLG